MGAGTAGCRCADPRWETRRNFRCPYHGWTYRNDASLVGVPVQREAYGDALDKVGLVCSGSRASTPTTA
ncbi:MAG: Rieske 2Fe-2S domain-containing protein [Actinomycetota bacterium]